MAEVQEIFLKYGTNYRNCHKLTLVQHKAMSAIQNCRTSQLGGHMDVCDSCGHTQISYNSCRNRHCPKCQTLAKERWIENQKSNLLDVEYFHVVFSIPDTLNLMAYQNQKTVYTLLFKTVAETLTELAYDKKYLGAKIGFSSILHTWGQNLMHHPHYPDTFFIPIFMKISLQIQKRAMRTLYKNRNNSEVNCIDLS